MSEISTTNLLNVRKVFSLPMHELLERAHAIHIENFPEPAVQLSSLLSIKTGGCPENCSYCPQSAHYRTGLTKEPLLSVAMVRLKAKEARHNGATRFCMGAAWREVKDGPEFDRVIEMVTAVKQEGLEVCCTLGMLNPTQASRLKTAGLYAYNHNIDSSREFYEKVITTRTYDDRLRTIGNVRAAGITVCTGGIIGMGETDDDRVAFLAQLATFEPAPESVTINSLIPIGGTPLSEAPSAKTMDLARVIASARILMPKSMIRLSAGRKAMTEEGQFLCFYAGANSIFLGDRLLTSDNPTLADDFSLLAKTGYSPTKAQACKA